MCVPSSCWTENMSVECTNELIGTCVPSAEPQCKCNELINEISPKAPTCGECASPDMDLAKGCLCKPGYRMNRSNGGEGSDPVYSCSLSSCVGDTVIAAMPECGALYNDIDKFKSDDPSYVFDYNKYQALYDDCACAGIGQCGGSSCTSCNSDNTLDIN